MTVESKENDEVFVSALEVGREAFLAEVVERTLALGECSPHNFIRHFSCGQIMQALAERPAERAKILVEAARMNPKIAERISPEAAGETLQIALDEGLTNPPQIVELFAADDRQRYLDDTALWAFAASGDPGRKNRKGVEFERGKKLVRYILERALHHKLIDAKQLISGLTVGRLTSLLPASLLASIIEAGLESSSKFSHADVLQVAPPERLVAHVPLDYVWDKVVVPLIASAHGYLGAVAPDAPATPHGSEVEGASTPEVPNAEATAEPEEGGTAANEQPGGEEQSERVSDVVALKGEDSPSVDADLGEDAKPDAEVVVEAEAEVAALAGDDEDDVLLDDDDEEVQMVSDDDDVFDDLLEEGLAETEPTSGANFRGGALEKKNANAN